MLTYRFVASVVVCVSVILFGESATTVAQEWTRFRGPNGTGESEAKSIPATWTESDLNWRIKLPGIGHAAPVVWGDKVFLFSADPKTATRHVLCVKVSSGETLWQRDFPSQSHHLHVRSSYASCTPAVDEERVYLAWSDPDHTWFKAFTHDGRDAWSMDLGPWTSQHGFGTSPVLVGDIAIVTCSQEKSKEPNTPDPTASFIVGVDRKTGELKWKTPRAIDTTSYSVPCVYQPAGGAAEVICCSTAEGLFSLNPKTGEQNWALSVFKMRTVSSPLIVGDLIFGSTGSGGGGNYVVAVKPGKNAEVAYEMKKEAPYVPTSVARGNLLFLWSDKGIVTCVDAKNGERFWQERVTGNTSGSPIRIADKIYCMDDEGVCIVLAAEKEFKELGRTPLGDPSRSTPAVAGGRLYLRTYSQLISVGGKTL